MKKTNFTFSGKRAAWLLRALVPVLFFMTLSLGVEAQAVSPGDHLSSQMGVTVVKQNVAGPRLKGHIAQLEAISPTTLQEEVDKSARLMYANYIMNDVAVGGFSYHVLNSRTFLEKALSRYDAQYRPSSAALYNEMISLLR